MTTLAKIHSNLKQLHPNASAVDFFKELLAALDFPDATWSNRVIPQLGLIQESIRIKNKLVYVDGSNLDEKEARAKIDSIIPEKEELLILRASSILYIKDFRTSKEIKVSISELHDEISFLFPLLNLSRIEVEKRQKPDAKLLATVCELFAALCSDNQNISPKEIRQFIFSIIICCFLDSTDVYRGSINSFIQVHAQDSSTCFADILECIFNRICDSCKNNCELVGCEKIPTISSNVPLSIPSLVNISASNRNKIFSMFCYDWADTQHEFFGLIYQCALGEDETSRKRTTFFYSDVVRALNPLFLTGLREKSLALKNREQAQAFVDEISSLKLLDPCCGSGSFLIYAYRDLSNMLALVQSQYGLPFSSLSIANFCGLDKNEQSCDITRISFFCTIVQLHQEEITLDVLIEASNVFTSSLVSEIESLEYDWSMYFECTPNTYVVSCPQFIGSSQQTADEKKEFQNVCRGLSNCKELDYCVSYFVKAAQYTKTHKNSFAYIVTSSLCVGVQVNNFASFLEQLGLYINFGHSRFSLMSEGLNSTSASAVIYGCSLIRKEQVFLYKDSNKKLLLQKLTPALSKYSIINVKTRNTPLSKDFPAMKKGNMPYSGTLNKFSTKQMQQLIAQEPMLAPYFKKLIGAQEISRGSFYWCLWITESTAQKLAKNPTFDEWCNKIRAERENYKDCPKTLISSPYLMREVNETTTYSFALNAVFSENRSRLPIEVVSSNVIVTNLAFVIYDCEQPWIYAVLLSHMHMIWAKTYCGKRETRIRYSNELGYNTFPFPEISATKKKELKIAGMRVLAIREQYFTTSISELWSENTMPNELRVALEHLDTVVESCYQSHLFTSDEERLSVMNSLYLKLITRDEKRS